MGNYRFRLSDMMPNAWFYKLKEMGKPRNHHNAKKKRATMLSASTAQQPAKTRPTHLSHYPRKSYYFTRELIPSEDRFYNSPTKPKSTEKIVHFPDAPRKSSKQRRNSRRNNWSAPKLGNSSVSAGCRCRATIWTKSESNPDYYRSSSSSSSSSLDISPELEVEEDCFPQYRSDRVLVTESFDNMVTRSSSCGCEVNSDNANDIFEDKKTLDKRCDVKFVRFDGLSDLELPRIITKPPTLEDEGKKEIREPTHCRIGHGSLSVKLVKEEKIGTREHKKSNSVRKCSVTSPGVRLRMNSPRIASRKMQAHGRRSTSSSSSSSSRRSNLSDSFAIVKSSFDPQRDFRESMVEMIVENNIRASKDLEDLLACYLSLNSDEYHELIIKVFKQIWFDLTDIKLKK